MKLQVAFDEVDSTAIVGLVDKIKDIVDIVEIGTPMIIREGMLPVRMVKEAFPEVTVLADTKIVDGGGMEAQMAYDAGADIATVLAVADDITAKSAADAARKNGRKIMADLITVDDVAGRAAELERLGFDYVAVHTAVDVKHTGRTPLDELALVAPALKKAGAVVMGGIDMGNILVAKERGAEVAVCGTALMRAPDLREAVREMVEAAHNG